jgi:hypothetical protein
MSMVCKINGVDIVPFIAYGGFKWQRSDVDGEGAGRDLSGDLRRNRVATKVRLDVTCKPLNDADTSTVLSLIMPEWVTVTYYDPQKGSTVTKTMYSNNNPASYLIKRKDGTAMWSGITFPLVEK